MTIEHFVAVEGAGDRAAVAASSLLMMRGDLGPSFFLLSGRTMSGESGGFPLYITISPVEILPTPGGVSGQAQSWRPDGRRAGGRGALWAPARGNRSSGKALNSTPKSRHLSWGMTKARPAHPSN